jgi:hypothetical protein
MKTTIQKPMPAIDSPQRKKLAKVRWIGLSVALLGTLVLGSGCAHTLEVKNIRTYEKVETHPLQQPLTIGVMGSTDDVGSHQLMKGVEASLGRYSTTVVLPSASQNSKKADVVANIKIQSEYKGSGWNFLINWPGFLIFTPAWNGYVYKANYNVDVTLTKGIDGNKLVGWSLPINLDLRQAEFDRTWTEIGWLEVGIIPLIGGIVFIGYDTDVTPILGEKIQNPIGDYIAQDIVNHINGCSNLVVHVPLAAPRVVSPPVAVPPVAPPAVAAPPVAAPPTVEAPPAETPPAEAPPATTPPAETPPAAAPSAEAPPA